MKIAPVYSLDPSTASRDESIIGYGRQGQAIYAMAGGAVVNIEALRGLDEYQAAEGALTARLTELDEEANGRPFSEDQRAEFEAISGPEGTLGRIRATIDELKIRDKTIRDVVGHESPAAEGPESGALGGFSVRKVPDNVYDLVAYRKRASSVDDLPAMYHDGAKRVIETARFPTAPDQAKARERVANLVATLDRDGSLARRVIQTDDPVYKAAWGRYVSGGLASLTPAHQAALQTYTDADGGYALPFTIDPSFILTSDGAVNPLRQMARVITITTKSWQGVTTGGVTAAYAATEVAAAADAAPSDIDGPMVTPKRAHVFIPFTAEYAEDYGIAAIQAEIGRLIQDAKDVLEAEKFVNGEGDASHEPLGVVDAIVDDTTSILPTLAGSTFALDDIDNLIASVPPRFRAKAQFLANLLVYQVSRGFATYGQVAGSIYDPTNKNLRGYPGGEASAMDHGVSTPGQNILLFGDFNQMVIVDRLGLTTEFVPQVFDSSGNPLGQRGVYARWRNSSKVLVFNAFRLLQVAGGS